MVERLATTQIDPVGVDLYKVSILHIKEVQIAYRLFLSIFTVKQKEKQKNAFN